MRTFLQLSHGSQTSITNQTFKTTPTIKNIHSNCPNFHPSNASKTAAKCIGSQNHLLQKERPNEFLSCFRRREAIAISSCFSLLDALLALAKPATAEEEEVDTATAQPCEFIVAASGLAFCDKVVGTGPQAVKGQFVKAHYVGKLVSGKVFDSSYDYGQPIKFRVGVGQVIKGWDEGILGGDGIPPMLAGGKRILKLPPQLGYGIKGAGCTGGSCVIPPDSVLLFDVVFIGKA